MSGRRGEPSITTLRANTARLGARGDICDILPDSCRGRCGAVSLQHCVAARGTVGVDAARFSYLSCDSACKTWELTEHRVVECDYICFEYHDG